MNCRTIAIDFDGTIVDHDFPDVRNPNAHAIRVIRRLQEKGYALILYTMRENSHAKAALDYLAGHGISMYLNENPDQHKWTPDSRKVFANLYIDDAALGTPLKDGLFGRQVVDWLKVETLLEERGIL